jgi:TolB-like protein/DNA-binding winged helix-turn-helix (wHTH) protein/Tfp pilus assembly protein PilF
MIPVYKSEESLMDSLGERDFRLGVWVVSPRLNCLSQDGRAIRVEPKVMQVLVCLAEARDVVSKERLMSRVWTGTFVTDDVLTRSISELRKVFEDDPKKPQYIQTIPKSGYRLLQRPQEIHPENGGQAAVALEAVSELEQVTKPQRSRAESNRLRLAISACLAAVLLVVLLAYARKPFAPPSPSVSRAMLAILPFQNLNNDPAQDYFADGLTAEMISQFGQLPPERLGVIAWGSMMRYKGAKKSEDEVGKELGANYVLEGTVRREGDRVRITAELVKVGERSHIWSNSYDGELKDVLALQSRVAAEIAGEIEGRMAPGDSLSKAQDALHRLRGSGDTNGSLDRPLELRAVDPQGYDAYLRGKALTESGQTDKAAENLKKAIELNPDYAPPYIELAMYYRTQASWEFTGSKSAYAKAKAAARKALELEPNSGAPHRELAWVDWRGDWNFAAADKEYQTAVKIDPGNASIREGYALYLKAMGRHDEALREINQCLELNPMQAISHANAGTILGLLHRYANAMEEFRKARELDGRQEYLYRRMGAVLLWQGKNEEAIKAFQEAAELSNNRPEPLAWLAYAYAVTGKRQAAIEVRDELLAKAQAEYVSPFYNAMVYAGFGDREKALAWLETAYGQHDEWMVYLKIYPEFASLHGDPRFQDLERRVGLE